ncbi:SipW-dependent-type signal peptide-containing protein [Agromyces endophyticus]|uniref:SipW-dependent-type signal peptide-containing protein n=1 Tax=Agromyces sp. H17E-10 TaxID=2932244 RepID=UPI001FD1A2E4|nr:SipW-dependent-type signal peptide-containing protein [Agromyces sp. H17E-10]UOQ87601.1 SipW-dependent-type signal peptide-containing protein [Agromyces sp. H17E-10]
MTNRARTTVEASANEGAHGPATDARTGPQPGDRRRKVLAILAGGLVLGVGAAVTLAVWNDSEFATGTFGAGSFGIDGSIDGTTFDSSPAAPGKTLTFELDADALSPGSTVYAPFAVGLTPTSDYEAAVTVASTTGGTIGANLTYSLYGSAAWDEDCSAASPPQGTALVADHAVTDPAAADAFDLTDIDTPQYLCFVVTAGSGLESGQTGTVTWEFAAESGDVLQ